MWQVRLSKVKEPHLSEHKNPRRSAIHCPLARDYHHRTLDLDLVFTSKLAKHLPFVVATVHSMRFSMLLSVLALLCGLAASAAVIAPGSGIEFEAQRDRLASRAPKLQRPPPGHMWVSRTHIKAFQLTTPGRRSATPNKCSHLVDTPPTSRETATSRSSRSQSRKMAIRTRGARPSTDPMVTRRAKNPQSTTRTWTRHRTTPLSQAKPSTSAGFTSRYGLES